MSDNENIREFRWIHIDPETLEDGEPTISAEPFPPRLPAEITDLVSSVRINGVLSPIIVRRREEGYQIIAGQRRYLAARAAGLSKIPAIVMDLEDAAAIRCYLSCKILRKPLPIDEQTRTLRILKELRDGILSYPSAGSEASSEQRVSPESPTKASPGPVAPRPSSTRPPTPPLDAAPGAVASWQGVADEIRARTELLDGPIAMDDHESALGFRPGTRQSLYRVGSGVQSGGDRLAGELLEHAQSLFLEIQATRAVSVEKAEELVDMLLARLQGPVPMDLRRLFAGASADIVPAHSLLVAALCAHVARCLGWNAESFRSLVLAGLLHDVGMLFVPSEAYKAPRLLTEEERAEVQGHSRTGYALLAANAAWSDEIALVARDHHERWDGSGYPAGLRAAETVFPARLVALLDMFGALLAPRPHRNALEPRAALQKVSRALELGLFDPSFHFLLKGTLQGARIRGLDDPNLPSGSVCVGNSVEMEGPFATMRTRDS